MKLVIHCSASPHGRGDNAEVIHAWHRENGWEGIGYHYVILEDGTVENGRPEYWPGAHVKGHNHDSIGICLIGEEEFTESQFQALEGLLRGLVLKYSDSWIIGHYQLDNKKTCPNFDVPGWLEEIGLS